MNLTSMLYLTELVSNIDGVLRLVIGIYLIICLITGFCWLISNDGYSDEHHEQANRILKVLLNKSWIIVIATAIQVAIPSKTTIYMMLGSNYLSNTNIPAQVTEILNMKLSGIIKDMKKHD